MVRAWTNRVTHEPRRTFHGRDGITALLKGVLGVAFSLQNGRLFDCGERDIIVRAAPIQQRITSEQLRFLQQASAEF